MKNNLEDRAKTGKERFMDKFPDWPYLQKPTKEFEYLGVGAPMVDPTQFTKYQEKSL